MVSLQEWSVESVHFAMYVPYMLLLLSAIVKEQWLPWTIQMLQSFYITLEWKSVRFKPANEKSQFVHVFRIDGVCIFVNHCIEKFLTHISSGPPCYFYFI